MDQPGLLKSALEGLLSPAPLAVVPEPEQIESAAKNAEEMCKGLLGTERSIQTFFRLLALGGFHHHRQDREEFWQQYLERGLILQSWLILGPGAAEVAQRRLCLRPHQFAVFERNKRIEDFHIVLLMRLTHFVVGEWSHQGKCRFWLVSNPEAPRFFKPVYQRQELIECANHVQQHYFSTKGLWQKDAAKWIAGFTGPPDNA